jgi:hypothetical protein
MRSTHPPMTLGTWLGGFPGFLIAIGFILITGIALKH